MAKDFRNFDPAQARVLLIQAAPRLLPTFPEPLSERARASLAALGVEVMLEQPGRSGRRSGRAGRAGARIAARTVLWAAGVVASPAARWLGAAAERDGRVKVSRRSLGARPPERVRGRRHRGRRTRWHGKPVPGLAPAAKQAGNYVAAVIHARVCRLRPRRRRSSTATSAASPRSAARPRSSTSASSKLRGAIAWWLWGLHPRRLPRRLPQPRVGDARLVLVLPDLPRRDAPDHRGCVAQPELTRQPSS